MYCDNERTTALICSGIVLSPSQQQIFPQPGRGTLDKYHENFIMGYVHALVLQFRI